MDVAQVALVGLAAAAGGAVQSVLGFGAAFMLVPAVALVAPEALPVAVIVGLLPLTASMAVRERRTVDRAAVVRLALSRLPGTALGVLAVRVLDVRGLTLVVAVILLLAVASAAAGWCATPTRTTEVVAGVVSGFGGTATGLGGPPLAIIYRERAAAELRPTLATVFVIGSLISLGALALDGAVRPGDVRVGAAIAVAVLAGLVLASPLVKRLPDRTVRTGLLVWAAVGSITALLRALAG